MSLLNIFLACFIIGLIATVISFVFSELNIAARWKRPTRWLSMAGLLVFLVWFGGAGFVFLSVNINEILAFLLAVVCGGVGYVAVVLVMNQALIEPDAIAHEHESEFTGTIGRVCQPILASTNGEIVFSKDGVLRVLPARSQSGSQLGLDTQVVILRIEHGVAYVEDVNQVLAQAGAARWLRENP
jgi:Ca2+/Na+ antiporter